MQGHFYHTLIRNYVNMFGNMFNNITIARKAANKKVVQSISVPITYANRQKYLKWIENRPDESMVAVTLPRLSFYITGVSLDQSRKESMVHKRYHVVDDNKKKMYTSFVEMPYKMDFELIAYVKNFDDGAQIFEQIAPYFKPDYSNTLKLFPQLGPQGIYDIRTELVGTSIQDDYTEGSFDDSRLITWTFNFTSDVIFMGPISENGVIKRIQIDFVPVPGSGDMSENDYTQYSRQERLDIRPGLTADGLPTTDIEQTIPYQDIEEDDPYGYITQIFNFADGKKYDPVSGRDK